MVCGLALLTTSLPKSPDSPPADTSTISACTVSSLPPLADSILSSTPPFFTSALFTLMPSLNFMPCLPSERWKAFLISPSCTASVSIQSVQGQLKAHTDFRCHTMARWNGRNTLKEQGGNALRPCPTSAV